MSERERVEAPKMTLPKAAAPDDEGIEYSEIPDMAGNRAFWAATHEGPVVVTARTLEVLREENRRLRETLTALLQALSDGTTSVTNGPGEAHSQALSAAVRQAQGLLGQPSTAGSAR